MKNRQSDSGRKRNVILLLLLFAVMALLFAKNRAGSGSEEKKETDVITWEETIQTEENSSEAEEAQLQKQTDEPEELCQEPSYEFTQEEITLELEGIDKEYTLAWVSDLHLVSDHKAGEENGDVHAEYLDAIDRRYEELAVTKSGVHAEELWPEIVKYLNYKSFDGVIFGGDLMDYCSRSNVEMIKEGLDALHMPYIYVRADHDYGAYYGGVFFTETEARQLHKTIDNDETANKFWDMGEFIVLGVDNSTKDMPDYYYNMISEVLTRGKPVIMVTHVPYESQTDTSLAELSMQVRNTIYYWSGISERYTPNAVTSQYLNEIYSPDTAVAQVLAGHLHASWDGMLTNQVSQHIFSPAFEGNIGIIHIVPKEG